MCTVTHVESHEDDVVVESSDALRDDTGVVCDDVASAAAFAVQAMEDYEEAAGEDDADARAALRTQDQQV